MARPCPCCGRDLDVERCRRAAPHERPDAPVPPEPSPVATDAGDLRPPGPLLSSDEASRLFALLRRRGGQGPGRRH